MKLHKHTQSNNTVTSCIYLCTIVGWIGKKKLIKKLSVRKGNDASLS